MHENLESAILIIVSLFLIIAVAVYSIHQRNQINIINDPTFVGEVVGKEATTQRSSVIRQTITYRLHITGEYIKDGETVQVDRDFIVSKELYDRFEIGDVIPKTS